MGAGIYIITNAESSKVYIGATVNFKNRWKQHRTKLRQGIHNNPHLQAAWNKYGEGAFGFGVLEYLDDSEGLHLAEQFWMDVYREESRELYNFGLAARNPMLGRKHTEETRRKIGKASRGQHFSEERCRNISEALTGRTRTEEHCRNLSMALQGRTLSEEHKRRVGEAGKGRIVSQETRRKISEGNKGKVMSEEAKRKIAASKARSHPTFIHAETGEVIPAGVNLKAMCQEHNLHQGSMYWVMHGKRLHHKGWRVAT